MATETDQDQTETQTIDEEQAADAVLDADDIALQEVENELESEAEGEGEAEEEDPQPDDPDPAPAAEGEGQAEGEGSGEGAAQAETPMIPKPRLDQVASERDRWRDRAMYLEGLAAAQQSMAQQPQTGAQGQPAAPEQTPDQKVAAFRAEQKEVAKRFDDGEISAEEMEAERQRLDDEIWSVRQGTLAAPEPQQGQQSQQRSDLYLEEKYAQLEAAHPYVTEITEAHHWDFLATQAVAELKAEGMAFDAGNPAHELAARTRMAELTDKYGPLWTGKTIAPAAGSQQQQGGQQQGKLSPRAQARKDKLELASDLPPDIGAAGNGGQGTEAWSEERVAALSEEEYEALPDSVKRHLEQRYGDGASP